MREDKGLILVISGPSGAGKGTVLSELFKINHSLKYSVSLTTREQRAGEKNGVNYFFVTKEEFFEHLYGDRLLEYAVYCGNYYGTPLDAVEKNIESGIDVVLEIEVKGALQVKQRKPEAVLIFITPPTIEELEKRLRGRGTESGEAIARRLIAAKEEMEKLPLYGYVVVNDDPARAAREIGDIIEKEKTTRVDHKQFGGET